MMNEWSPWFDHNGIACPCQGQYVRVETAGGQRFESRAEACEHDPPLNFWKWHTIPQEVQGLRIVKYQVLREAPFRMLLQTA